MDWLNATLVAVWVAAVGQTAFMSTYGTKTPWRSNFVGRAIFWKAAALSLVLGLSLVNHYATYAYQVQVTCVVMWLVAVSIWGQFVALVFQLRSGRPTN